MLHLQISGLAGFLPAKGAITYNVTAACLRRVTVNPGFSSNLYRKEKNREFVRYRSAANGF
ncbi:hypothetical protein [Undibacterium sp.]|jgi:hypothetical protein|uniref:hypothetical protein n=1 Tax=Undibacterium sp. TaxID=1914977 RepID=UPI002C093D92|nr:hypothetical protein [Undibacterium sp.]HTD04035.1 hypothetical protein [Undibacterium sp.]